jgi:hypothetical protein
MEEELPAFERYERDMNNYLTVEKEWDDYEADVKWASNRPYVNLFNPESKEEKAKQEEWQNQRPGRAWVMPERPERERMARPDLAAMQRQEKKKKMEAEHKLQEAKRMRQEDMLNRWHAPYFDFAKGAYQGDLFVPPPPDWPAVPDAPPIPVPPAPAAPLPQPVAYPQPVMAPIAAAPGAARQRAVIGGAMLGMYGMLNRNKALSFGTAATALGLGLAWAGSEKQNRQRKPLEPESESEEEKEEKTAEPAPTATGQTFSFTPIKVEKAIKKPKYRPRPPPTETPLMVLVDHLSTGEQWTKKRRYKIRMAKVQSPSSNFKYLAEIKKLKKKRKKH